MSLPLAGLLLIAQAFDVASVKPVQLHGDLFTINLGKISNGVVTLGNASLADCLKFAYGLTNDIQLAGPDWIRNKVIPFDVVGKAPADTPREKLLLMLQGLLIERFQLRLHHEQRQAAYLALLPGKAGPSMPEATQTVSAGNRFVPGQIISSSIYMSMLARLLSRFLREPVLDQTGLASAYAVKLEWTPDPDDPLKPGAVNDRGPSIYTAVGEQLGLKLESKKGLIDVLVIDEAERTPIAN